jgi:hypothetical protein
MSGGLFDEIAQVSIVVDDIKAYIQRYNDDYGIGPWAVLHFSQENTQDMTVNGREEPFEMYLGLCDSLNVQLELIQPVSRNTTYWDFLEKHGPGIHHLSLGSREGFASIIQKLEKLGHKELLLSGRDSGGMTFCYVDLTGDLGLIAELADPPENFICPPPVWEYPDK